MLIIQFYFVHLFLRNGLRLFQKNNAPVQSEKASSQFQNTIYFGLFIFGIGRIHKPEGNSWKLRPMCIG
jgi:hypothetical protein